MKSKPFCWEEFSAPEAFYWPGYIWFWNDRITASRLRRQLRDMADRKALSVWPFAWPNFRPTTNPTSMSPEYLSKDFLRLYKQMVREADRLGMKVWLYDEGGWPSGGVCGRLVRENPSLGSQSLRREELYPKAGETVDVPEDCLSAFLYKGQRRIRRLKPSQRIVVTQKGMRVVVLKRHIHTSPTPTVNSYPDLLNPAVTREFLRMTHEKYRETVGKYFGETIPLVFTDEPKVPNPPWTKGLAKDFRRTMGYDILPHLPSIFEGDSPKDMRVRIDFADWWSRRYADAYFGQIQRWCRKNGLLSVGHVGGEDETLGPSYHGYGHLFRIYRNLDIPGVDTIWRQIFPGKKTVMDFPSGNGSSKKTVNVNHYFPKFAASVAHQQNKPWVVTESFCVYGSGLTPARMKWVTDFQYVRGVNLMTMGAYPLSTRDHYMGTQRPAFGPSNPIWKYMDLYHAYTARLSYLLSRGKPDVQAAVYYPIRDIWAKGPEQKAVGKSLDRLSRYLLEHQTDYDFIDDDMLTGTSSRVTPDGLIAGSMLYKTVFVPRTRWMSEPARKQLAAFARAGGKVVCVDRPTDVPKIKGSVLTDYRRLGKSLQPVVEVSAHRRFVRVLKRKLRNGNLYFLTNESQKRIHLAAWFDEVYEPMVLDPETGRRSFMDGAKKTRGRWRIEITLDFAGSIVVLFENCEKCAFEKISNYRLREKPLLEITKGFSAGPIREYRVGKRNLEVLERPRARRKAIRPGDWRKCLGEGFSGDVEYSVTFSCPKNVVETARCLDLGDVRCACEAFLNGQSLGRRAWAPFAFSIDGALRAGKNELKIIVTNTLANQYATTKNIDRWPTNVIGPYHAIGKVFETDSQAGGLIGPVRILT
ncbi:MAG: hypothetical protein JXA11_01215 [Phycisphaerae bacterium]|nr:hypothetical protein [Phycisphaerae bacterium]